MPSDRAAARWLSWSDGSGTLFCGVIAPTQRRIRVVGGNSERSRIGTGPFQGRTYVGGGPATFERLIGPAGGKQHPQNAWFKLGSPTALGNEVGRTPQWGRIEVESVDAGSSHLIVTLLWPDSAALDSSSEGDELQFPRTVGRRVDTIVLSRRDRRFQWSSTAREDSWTYSPAADFDRGR